MNVRIFLDTNIIFTDREDSLKEVFNDNIPRISKFIKDNDLKKDVVILLPELVFLERLQHKVEEIGSAINIANRNIEKLSELGHSGRPIKQKKNYLRQLQKDSLGFLKKNQVDLIPIPKIESEELVRRAVHKIKPFKSKGVGFKDTLILLTLIEHGIREKSDYYIFCTNNLSDFSEETQTEFKNKTGKDLIIVPGIIQLEEQLDVLFVLRLKRKERDELIKNTILKKVGELMIVVNKNNNNSDPYSLRYRHDPYSVITVSDRLSLTAFQDPLDENSIAGYDFNNIEINNIEEKDSNNYQVNLTVDTRVRYSDENKNSRSLRFGVGYDPLYMDTSFNRRIERRGFKINLLCDTKTGNLEINSVKSTL